MPHEIEPPLVDGKVVGATGLTNISRVLSLRLVRCSSLCYNADMKKNDIGTNKKNNLLDAAQKSKGSISHAALILNCLSEGIHTVSEIAYRCALGKSTVHRVLKLLEDIDMVMQDVYSHSYYLGPLVARLNATPFASHEYLTIFALEEMKKLSGLSEETVALDILIGLQLVPIFELPSLHDLRVTENKATGGPLHTGASRKVLLSQLQDNRLDFVLNTISFEPTTEYSVTDRETLVAQLKAIRKQGYAVSFGERNRGVVCVSVPLLHYTFPAALSVIGPEVRLEQNLKVIIEESQKSGELVSERLREYAVSRNERTAAA